MSTYVISSKNAGLDYLRKHASTNFLNNDRTIREKLTYLKDCIISIFNINHKFARLGNKSIAEFNFEHMQEDISKFINNPALNNDHLKDQEDFVKYKFEYNQNSILPNINDIYRSGRIEPNEMITQSINYLNKFKLNKLSNDEKQYYSSVKGILQIIIDKKDIIKNEDLIKKIEDVSNSAMR